MLTQGDHIKWHRSRLLTKEHMFYIIRSPTSVRDFSFGERL